jgi:hypothetical protein
MEGFEIVAAFADGERVDAQALKAALARPEIRDYLADLIALREVVGQSGPQAAVTPARPGRRWLVAAAAAVMLSLGGGYALGARLSSPRPDESGDVSASAAPQPTRVIEVAPGASFVSQGGK